MKAAGFDVTSDDEVGYEGMVALIRNSSPPPDDILNGGADANAKWENYLEFEQAVLTADEDCRLDWHVDAMAEIDRARQISNKITLTRSPRFVLTGRASLNKPRLRAGMIPRIDRRGREHPRLLRAVSSSDLAWVRRSGALTLFLLCASSSLQGCSSTHPWTSLNLAMTTALPLST